MDLKSVVGERIKTARVAAGMSQRELARRVGVSNTAVHKYEKGEDMPGSEVFLRISGVLGVKMEYFFRPPAAVKVSLPNYRKKKSLSRKAELSLLARVQDWLERYRAVEDLFPEEAGRKFSLPEGLERRVSSFEDVERLAIDLREAWNIGLDPLGNLAELLEEKGIKVGVLEADDRFDALMLMADGSPVVVVRRGIPGDRERFSIAHELGHLVMEVDGLDEEKTANRFAGAFLIPMPAAYMELGKKRSRLDFKELLLLKYKYGVSMAAWVLRARDLEIISEGAARGLFSEMKRNGWWAEEPGVQIPQEVPRRMERLVARAVTENLITVSAAAELLGVSPLEFRDSWKLEALPRVPEPVRG